MNTGKSAKRGGRKGKLNLNDSTEEVTDLSQRVMVKQYHPSYNGYVSQFSTNKSLSGISSKQRKQKSSGVVGNKSTTGQNKSHHLGYTISSGTRKGANLKTTSRKIK